MLLRTVPREMFKISRLFRSESLAVYGYLQPRHFVLIGKNQQTLFSEKIIFCKYSTKSSRVSGASEISDLYDEVNEVMNKHKGEDNAINIDGVVDEEKAMSDQEKIFEEISQGDPQIMKKLKILEFEIGVLRSKGFKVISYPSKTQWETLLKIADKPLKYKTKILLFMGLNENLRLRELQRKKINYEKKLIKKKDNGFHQYGFPNHSMFPYFKSKFQNHCNEIRHLMARQKILFDCSYEDFMSDLNLRLTAIQIHMSVLEAERHFYPCQLGFCNLSKNGKFGEILPTYVPKIFEDEFCFDVSDKDISDIYPKDKLVYLTPDSPHDLVKINEDDIYVIGAFVDRGTGEKASLAKIKEGRYRMAKFPIDLYLNWKQRTKSLPINIVIKIMLDMAFYREWNIAFKGISSQSRSLYFNRGNFDDVVKKFKN